MQSNNIQSLQTREKFICTIMLVIASAPCRDARHVLHGGQVRADLRFERAVYNNFIASKSTCRSLSWNEKGPTRSGVRGPSLKTEQESGVPVVSHLPFQKRCVSFRVPIPGNELLVPAPAHPFAMMKVNFPPVPSSNSNATRCARPQPLPPPLLK
jgi:hypothetical protein